MRSGAAFHVVRGIALWVAGVAIVSAGIYLAAYPLGYVLEHVPMPSLNHSRCEGSRDLTGGC